MYFHDLFILYQKRKLLNPAFMYFLNETYDTSYQSIHMLKSLNLNIYEVD